MRKERRVDDSFLCADGTVVAFVFNGVLEFLTVSVLLAGFLASVISFKNKIFYRTPDFFRFENNNPMILKIYKRRYQIYAAFFMLIFVRLVIEWGCGHLD